MEIALNEHPIICRSIERGDISTDGEHIVLYADYNSATYQLFIPSAEAPRLIALICGLMEDASKRRSDNSSPVFEAKKIEFMPDPSANREIISIQLGQSSDSRLYFAVPIGKLAEMARGILTAMGQSSPIPPGRAH